MHWREKMETVIASLLDDFQSSVSAPMICGMSNHDEGEGFWRLPFVASSASNLVLRHLTSAVL